MRCYLVSMKIAGEVRLFRYAGTNAQAKETKEELCEAFGLGPRTKDIIIEQTDVLLAKDDLLVLLNGLAKRGDQVVAGGKA